MIIPDHAIAKMCLLGDGQLIHPFIVTQLQPASYDLRLGNEFMQLGNQVESIDPKELPEWQSVVTVPEDDFFVLHPGECVLAATVEWFAFSNDVAGQLGGKSSLGRLGLQVHATAGFFDPGFSGHATLELSNIGRVSIRLYPGMKIAQMVFLRLESPCERPYGTVGLGSKYKDQTGPQPSLYHHNFA